jgi:hypothetical protein
VLDIHVFPYARAEVAAPGEARPTRRASHLHILRNGAGVGGGIRVVCVPIKVVASISLWVYLVECVDGFFGGLNGFPHRGPGGAIRFTFPEKGPWQLTLNPACVCWNLHESPNRHLPVCAKLVVQMGRWHVS